MKIAVLTSGGDCPGMNACLYSIACECEKKGHELFAVPSGYKGLIDNKFNPLKSKDIFGSITLGGSIIGTSRCLDFFKKKYFTLAVENLKNNHINYLIVIGGNGSLTGASKLENEDIKTIGIPGSIDNDLVFDKSLGFDSAINSAMKSIDDIMASARSLKRGVVIELMGRDCVDISSAVAKATFADLLIKELVSPEQVARDVKNIIKSGVDSPLVILKEYSNEGLPLTKMIEAKTKKQFKFEQLGYIQRGCAPTAFDRAYANKLGIKAIESIEKGFHNLVLGVKNNDIVAIHTPIAVLPRGSELKIFN